MELHRAVSALWVRILLLEPHLVHLVLSEYPQREHPARLFLLVLSALLDLLAQLSMQVPSVHLVVQFALLARSLQVGFHRVRFVLQTHTITSLEPPLVQPVLLALPWSLLHLVVVPHLLQAPVRSIHPSISLDLKLRVCLPLRVSSTRTA